jgi:subtilisin family serine protease
MRKSCFILMFLGILISMESFSQTKEKRYYYAYGEKNFLTEIPNKMLISCYATSEEIKAKLKDIAETVWHNDSICLVTLDASQKKEALKNSLRQIKGIKSIQPLYLTDEGDELGVTDEIVLQFNKDVSQHEMDELHKKYQVAIKKVTDLYHLISIPVDADALEIANQYQLSGLVNFSHPNFIAKIELHRTIPADPYFVNQFYLYNTGQTMPDGHSGTAGADINIPDAWDITKGNSDIIVAVLDQGVVANHPDLPNSRQVRLNGSNFGDGDVNNPSPTGNDNHGNACAGIIAASQNNEGIAGIAPNCKIMPIRIFNSDDTGISSTQLADAITFAKNNGAHILSNSWGYNSSNPNLYPVIKSAIEDATTTGRNGKGCVVVFAAGNTANHVSGSNGYITFPSNVNVSGVLTVGASDRYDQQSNYSPTSNLSSSYNQIVDIVAPSHKAYSCQISTETFEIWTIDMFLSAGYNPVKNSDCGSLPEVGTYMPDSGVNYHAYTGYFGGTSASCPEVAGVAALILSLNPSLTQKQVADIIESTARKAGGYSYQTTSGIPNGTWNSQMGHGVLDACAAIQTVCPTVDFINQDVTSDTTVTSCGNIHSENVYVNEYSKLTLDAAGKTRITSNFWVQLGSRLEIK